MAPRFPATQKGPAPNLPPDPRMESDSRSRAGKLIMRTRPR